MGTKLFGTDGVRGVANREPLRPETLARLGRGIGEALLARGLRPRALLGRDSRQSGPMVAAAVAAGLASAGVSVTDGGILPTPAVARLARLHRFGLGVVISASHNPWEDNGVKLFLGDGRKVDEPFEREVEERLAAPAREDGPEPADIGTKPDAPGEYVSDLHREFAGLRLAPLRIVVDAANGATSEAGSKVLTLLGARVRGINDHPDGRNINRRCGALHPGVVAAAARKHGAHAGVAFDGDGDRAIFADENGRVLDGDAILAILARDLAERRRLPKKTVVATVMSNLGLARSLGVAGVRLETVPVGDRNVVEAMRAGGYALGGEQSGHVIVRKGSSLIGDGLVTAIHVFRVLRESKRPLSELAACFASAPQRLINVRVREKPPLLELKAVREAVRAAEAALGGDGRVLVRYSGTEPLARVMVEGLTEKSTWHAAEDIAEAIRREIGKT